MSNIVAIVGRPNVGKSSLFNRFIEERKAITDDESGVTRDRHYGQATWGGKYFTVIDTGGYVVGSGDVFEEAIREQVEMAVEEASVVLFMIDAVLGLNGLDYEFAEVIRRSKKPVFVVANKIDTPDKEGLVNECYELGFDKVFPVSATSGLGTGDILDEVIACFAETGLEDPYAGFPKICILGRPNVGKSSFLNALLGKERSIVTEIAGTTRDSVDTFYNAYGKEFVLTDTAGLRRKSRVKENIEFYSVLRSLKAMEDSDVCIMMLDATKGLEAQDVNIINLAHKQKKGIMIMVNKWDLVEEKESNTAKNFEDGIRRRLSPIDYMPIIFTSVITKQRIFKAIEKAIDVYANRITKISTSKLNDLLLEDIEKTPPPSNKGKQIKIKYITQLPTFYPSFAFFCNLPQYIKEPYQRFLERKIREHFDFEGVPMTIYFRKK